MNGVDRLTGKLLSGPAHLRQSVADILSTPVGSRVLVREYGSDLLALVDNPQGELTRIRIIAATATALARWEPRLTVTRVTVAFTDDSACELTIDGINNENNTAVTLEGIQIYGRQL